MNTLIFILLALGGVLIGYLSFQVLLWALPFLEKRESNQSRQDLLKEANKQRDAILKDVSLQSASQRELLSEELQANLESHEEDIESQSQVLEEREAEISDQTIRYEKLKGRVDEIEHRIHENQDLSLKLKDEVIKHRGTFVEKLALHTNLDWEQKKAELARQLIDDRLLESQRMSRLITEELNLQAKKRAFRLMSRVMARYEPTFIWPKMTNVVEIQDPKILSQLEGEHNLFIKGWQELAEGVNVTVAVTEGGQNAGFIKVAGGFGIYREALRLSIEEVSLASKQDWNLVFRLYEKHKEQLTQTSIILGRKATTQLKLENIHPEVEKLVGALNWRTSYRQNQWYHTVEVATLAGILASELHVDPILAKRAGLLHDIGKAIDYKIDGSHAVISGDYADRYGESRMICDTVMSHHADLLVETPLAYILRAADTFSGARPGARVNIEEGYQIRLDAIFEAIHSFQGVSDVAIMNGGREVHVQVHPKKIAEHQLAELSQAMAKKIEEMVAYPGQIKVLVSRSFEIVTVA